MKHLAKLSAEERDRIAAWRGRGVSVCAVARRLGRNASTISRFLSAEENAQKQLWAYLPWKRTKRQRKTGRSVHRSHIPSRVSIHARPEAVNAR